MKKNLIDEVAKGNLSAFDKIYVSNKEQFLSRMKKDEGVDGDSAQDLYQEACAALYNNICTGRLTGESLGTNKLSTYLNKVGKYILYNKRRKRQVPLYFDTDKVFSFEKEEEEYDYSHEIRDARLFIVRTSVRDMPKPCSELLRLVLFLKKSHEEVAKIMGYSNADSVKTQRSKCMRKLREVAENRFDLYAKNTGLYGKEQTNG